MWLIIIIGLFMLKLSLSSSSLVCLLICLFNFIYKSVLLCWSPCLLFHWLWCWSWSRVMSLWSSESKKIINWVIWSSSWFSSNFSWRFFLFLLFHRGLLSRLCLNFSLNFLLFFYSFTTWTKILEFLSHSRSSWADTSQIISFLKFEFLWFSSKFWSITISYNQLWMSNNLRFLLFLN